LSVSSDKAGKKIRCPDCQTTLTVPQADPDKSASVSAGARRRKKSESTEEADIWSQPLSSYSSPAIEEHEYEQLGIPRRQPKKNESENASSEVSLKGPLIFFAIGMITGLVSIGMAFTVPKAGLFVSYAALGIGALLSVWGHWQIRELAFNESTMTGFLYLWFFPYTIYFIFSRFSETRTAFFAEFMGNIAAVTGAIGMALANIQLEKGTGTTDVQPPLTPEIVIVETA
jgi:hypothetical protein